MRQRERRHNHNALKGYQAAQSSELRWYGCNPRQTKKFSLLLSTRKTLQAHCSLRACLIALSLREDHLRKRIYYEGVVSVHCVFRAANGSLFRSVESAACLYLSLLCCYYDDASTRYLGGHRLQANRTTLLCKQRKNRCLPCSTFEIASSMQRCCSNEEPPCPWCKTFSLYSPLLPLLSVQCHKWLHTGSCLRCRCRLRC